jgi:excisionase family DNA binding protein
MIPHLLTPKEASELTRLSVKTLYAKCCRREIPFVKLGGKLLFDQAKLVAWIEKHSVEPQ